MSTKHKEFTLLFSYLELSLWKLKVDFESLGVYFYWSNTLLGCMYLRSSSTSGVCIPEPEARAEACEVTAVGFALGWLSEPEEGVAFDSTLPQVLTFPRTRQLKHERVFLFSALQTHITCTCTWIPFQSTLEYRAGTSYAMLSLKKKQNDIMYVANKTVFKCVDIQICFALKY